MSIIFAVRIVSGPKNSSKMTMRMSLILTGKEKTPPF